jgi:hypothetical protein
LPALSDKVLSDRLAQLTSADVIERHRTPGWPPRVRYVLTAGKVVVQGDAPDEWMTAPLYGWDKLLPAQHWPLDR